MREGRSPFEFEPDEFLNSDIRFGKYKGWTWLDVVYDDPNYIKWCIETIDFLTEVEKNTLTEAIESLDER